MTSIEQDDKIQFNWGQYAVANKLYDECEFLRQQTALLFSSVNCIKEYLLANNTRQDAYNLVHKQYMQVSQFVRGNIQGDVKTFHPSSIKDMYGKYSECSKDEPIHKDAAFYAGESQLTRIIFDVFCELALDIHQAQNILKNNVSDKNKDELNTIIELCSDIVSESRRLLRDLQFNMDECHANATKLMLNHVSNHKNPKVPDYFSKVREKMIPEYQDDVKIIYSPPTTAK